MNDTPFVINIDGPESFTTNVLELSQQLPVLVDFWADWCQPCQILVPILTKLAEEYQGEFILAKVNCDEQQELAAQAGVRNLPTVMLFHQGKVVETFTGVKPENEIKELLDKYTDGDPVQTTIDKALEASQNGQTEQALEALKSLNAAYPENYNVHLAIAQIYFETEQLELCQELLNALPNEVKEQAEAKALISKIELSQSLADAPDLSELENQIKADPTNLDLHIQFANVLTAHQRYEEALQVLLFIVQTDRSFNDNAGQQGMLKIFDMLGGQDPIVRKYRGKLFSLLN